MSYISQKAIEYFLVFLHEKAMLCLGLLVFLILLTLMSFTSIALNISWVVTIGLGVYVLLPVSQHIRKKILSIQRLKIRKEPAGFLTFCKYFFIAEIFILLLLHILAFISWSKDAV